MDNRGGYKPHAILITGGAGFIASHVTNRLVKNHPDYKIVVLDKLDYCSSIRNLLPARSSPNFKFVKGDITSPDLVNYLLIAEGIDTIMHFAAQTHVDNSFGNSFEFTKNNIYGTHVLLEACKAARPKVKRFIHVSTDEVYGETEADAIAGNLEASQLLPTNPYSATKAGAEMLVMAYARSYGLPVVTTRGNNVYGPNQFPEKLIPKLLLLAMRGQKLPIHGDGSNVRSYLYCEDVAEAFDVVLHNGQVGNVYNIGTTRETRVIDVAQNICDLFNLDSNKAITFVENRPFNDQRYFLDTKKLSVLGWSEKTSWEEGLRKTKEWYIAYSDWWGDVSGALVPHPRMLALSGAERKQDISADQVKVSGTNYEKISPMNSTVTKKKLKFLIYGKTGWIGGLLGEICREQGIEFAYGNGRLENRDQIESDLKTIRPTHVLNAAGVTGRPNVDWCESHRTETIKTNVVGTLTLADVCKSHGLLLVIFATGCIFEYDKKHPEGSGIGFKEDDKPNFIGSFYSKTKAMVEDLLSNYDNVCTLRVRMPISSDLSNPRNFITKITRYDKVVNIPNSMTVLDELLPISIEMAKRNLTGIWNFTNPGVVSHNEILEMYRDYVDLNFKWTNFTLEEQAKVIVAPRSNNELDASKLKKEFPEMLPIKESILKYVFIPRKKGNLV
ncbi:trifunctional UDP-glucose 4,6-dehydratase/UDP-4-keto-6-deoxy-D-glucose 3,5-epimerase/UDP-4-keto-L-rhamnose-reductase RHM1-like [Telopea speciosissima]|uniref:trifunctional UDP-glucose 4,6-dehydratase/UDP-4-keto-6-deoxy-D-glucose 3,5-epimerase/UDP-4-keto-L-rhamnose-reductase RHM1-like n=1 Tax=Telopea speciosissima TaxID=54955 RepID=UPI001CC7ECC4|nr:trifunctional UDP-glucose 4,6-dehydratase/UDP-4-keto-6-deoxy-D-glucose 3,5-epimerase/UDP-4-keto-L-rhamnose-reductase RHM1-like [Telopea speciosissima]